LLFGALAGTQIASADTAAAPCEVRKDGHMQGERPGPCTFGKRQGYIDLDLRNGVTYSLSPGNKANHYHDQKGNKVVRTVSTANSQEFRREKGAYVTVRFNAASNGDGGHNAGYGAASAYGNGAQGSEYQRGTWDKDKHNQEYKDGYRAGEQAAGGGNSADGSYYMNPLSNGGFEVVWKNSCVASYTRQRDMLGYADACNNN